MKLSLIVHNTLGDYRRVLYSYIRVKALSRDYHQLFLFNSHCAIIVIKMEWLQRTANCSVHTCHYTFRKYTKAWHCVSLRKQHR
jgi:hypothetical protein